MVELVREESLVAERRVESSREAALVAVEEAKRLREERKREALERSRQRQSNPEYFLKKKESAAGREPVAIDLVPSQPSSDIPSAALEEEDDSSNHVQNHSGKSDAYSNDTTDSNYDPFRSYKSNTRPKIYVK
jgi:hypothetical protein